MLTFYSDAILISIPAVTGASIFAVGLGINVTKTLCTLGTNSGRESLFSRVFFKIPFRINYHLT